jgi:hypothetical protein
MTDEEWDWLATRGRADAGTHQCNACHSEFLVDEATVALTQLGMANSSDSFDQGWSWRALDPEELRWIAVGRTVKQPGLVCRRGDVEFVLVGKDRLRLVRADHDLLAEEVGKTDTLTNWHRLARSLPLTGQEEEMWEELDQAAYAAYVNGEIGLDGLSNDLVWLGKIRILPNKGNAKGRSGTLRVTPDTATFRGTLHRRSLMANDVASIEQDGNKVTLRFRSEDEPWTLLIEPIEWRLGLQSGKRHLKLTPELLANRLRRTWTGLEATSELGAMAAGNGG